MLAFQYVAVVCDCVSVYFVFISLDAWPTVWIVFVGFVIAMAGMSVVGVPGGGGSFEVLMSGFYQLHGIRPGVSIAAALLYRLVAFWLPMFVSAVVFWRRRLIRRQTAAGKPQRHCR